MIAVCFHFLIPLDDINTLKPVRTFEIDTDFIQLDKLLKACRIAASGGEAHVLVENGDVRLNGKVEQRKRAKLRDSDVVEVLGERIAIKSTKKHITP